MGLTQSTDAHLSALSDSLSTERFKMAAASSIQPPSVHAIQRENSPHPESDSPASRQEEDAASEGTTILRDLPELDPEEIEKRLEKTRRELSNRRKILIKNLPQDTTNQVKLERFTSAWQVKVTLLTSSWDKRAFQELFLAF